MWVKKAIADLKCKITKGAKLDALKEVFYLTPQPPRADDPSLLSTLPMAELKALAKSRNLTGYSKLKKSELIERLSQ